MRYLLLLLWFCLLIGGSAEESRKVTLKFEVEPRQAEFRIQGTAEQTPFSPVDRPFVIDSALLEQGLVTVEFRAEGYEPTKRTYDLKAQAISGSEFIVIPPQKAERPLQMIPNARRWVLATLVASSGLLLIGGALFLSAQRRKERLAELERTEKARIPEEGVDDLIGRIVYDYELVEKLGQGGMATVYKGVRHDAPEEAPVAIKLVHSHLTKNEEFRKRFHREALISNDLRHKNIVTVLHASDERNRFYIILELIEGSSLRDLIPEKGLSTKEGLPLLIQVAEALFHAHKYGIIHRDVKPDNVLVRNDGVVKLSDFGLARSHQYTTVTATGSIIGTPAYMAPEQVKSEPLTELSDQYSLGVLAFHLFTGRLPFQDEEMMSLMVAHARRDPPAPSSINPEIPAELEAVILRMMAKAPADRFPNLGLVIEELSRCS